MGLFDYLTARLNAARLQDDNDWLIDERDEWKSRYFTEVRSNRTREDELVNAALEAAKLQSRAGTREEIKTGKPEIGPLDEVDIDAPTDAQIDVVANQFIENAKERGQEYDEAATALLKAEIRQNPREYFNY